MKQPDCLKDHILATALEIIQQQGEETASFRLLAEKMGVTPMAISYHVGSKKKMLRNVIRVAFFRYCQQLQGHIAQERIKFSVLCSKHT